MSSETLHRLIKYLLLIPVFIPLVFLSALFFPFITGKVLILRVIVELALVASVIYFWRVKTIKYPLTPVWWFYFIFLVLYFVAAIFGVFFNNSFWSNIERADGVIFLAHLFVYFCLVTFYFRKSRDWILLFRSSLIAGFLVLVYGYIQQLGWFGAVNTSGLRISSTLGNAAYLGTYLLINFFFALYLIFSDKNKYWQLFYAVSALVSFITIFLTQTRGAILGVLGGVIILSLLNLIRKTDKKIKLISVASICLLVLLVGLVFAFRDTLQNQPDSNPFKKISAISYGDYTTKTRLLAWQTAFTAFKDRPILGWGPENYNYAFGKYFPAEIYRETDSQLWFDRAHNVFFEYLVTIGILGLGSYILLIASIIYFISRSSLDPVRKNILIGLIFGYLFANMFVFDSSSTYILFALILALANILAVKNVNQERELKWNNLAVFVSIIVIIFFVYIGYRSNIESIISNRRLWQAQKLEKEGQTEQAYHKYLSAVENNNDLTRFEVRRFFILFVMNSADGFPNYEQSNMYDKAIEIIKRSIAEDPNDIRHLYNLCQLYLESYQFDASRLDELISLGPKMISLGPTRAHTYYQIGDAYFRKGDYKNALENFQKAAEINQNLPDPFVNIYVTAIITGDKNLETSMEEKIKSLQPDFFEQEKHILRFISLFKRVNRNDRLESDLKKLIVLNPEKIEYVSSLALLYAEIGQNAKSEETIKTLLGRDKVLDQKVADFIAQLKSGSLLNQK